MLERRRFQKGFFGRARLPVAESYLHPPSRNRVLVIGVAAAIAFAATLAAGFWLTGGGLASSGPLSFSHALLQDDCESCHSPFEAVSSGKCLVCHGEGDPSGIGYQYAAHYVYRSDDPTRASIQSDGEVACSACHQEHRGLEAVPITATNASCGSCHGFSNLSSHPELAFQARERAESSSAPFAHAEHLAAGDDLRDLRGACAGCHQLEPSGRHFIAIDYNAHCHECHKADGQEEASALQARYGGSRRETPRRAEFSHAAHGLLKTCLECHQQIQLSSRISRPGSDQAHSPGIEVCRQCHDARSAPDNCTHCHLFHPGPTRSVSQTEQR